MTYPGEMIMVSSNGASERRRRIVGGADAVAERECAEAVAISDLSSRGFLLRHGRALKAGSEIWMKLRGSPHVRARVLWALDGEAGCEFVFPLTARSVREMIIAARPAAESPRMMPTRIAVARAGELPVREHA